MGGGLADSVGRPTVLGVGWEGLAVVVRQTRGSHHGRRGLVGFEGGVVLSTGRFVRGPDVLFSA